MLKKGVGRNSLNVYLSFWRIPLESIFSFTGWRNYIYIYIYSYEGIGSLVQDSFHFLHPVISAVVSIYLITSTTVPQIPVLARDSPHLFTTIPFFKTDFLNPYFRWRKVGYHFRSRALANHLAFFLPFPGDSLGLLSIHPVTECKHLLAFILTWICYFGREELT